MKLKRNCLPNSNKFAACVFFDVYIFKGAPFPSFASSYQPQLNKFKF